MNTTTYKAINFRSGDVIPAGVEVSIRPLRHKTENRSHPTMCILSYNDKEYKCRYESVIEPPSEDEIGQMVFDSKNCSSIGGHDVEPDGFDPDGFPSWLMALGLC